MTDDARRFLLRIPESDTEKLDMLSMVPLPAGWERLLFDAELRAGIDSHAEQWRGYQILYAPVQSPEYKLSEIPNLVSEQLNVLRAITGRMMELMSPAPQAAAFGAPGQPGYRKLIEYLARRLADSYGLLLAWGLGALGLHVPAEARGLLRAVAKMASNAVSEFREWSTAFGDDLIEALTALSNGSTEKFHVDRPLRLTVSDDVKHDFQSELDRLSAVILQA